MEITKEIIKHEIEIIAKEVAIVESIDDNNKAESVAKLIQVKLESNFKPTADYINWITDQVFNNDLHKNSSGSFETAVRDFDNFACGFDLEDNQDLYDYARELFKTNKIF